MRSAAAIPGRKILDPRSPFDVAASRDAFRNVAAYRVTARRDAAHRITFCSVTFCGATFCSVTFCCVA